MTLLWQSVPVFLTAPLLLIIFALELDILPTHGFGGLLDARIILPAFAMGIPGVAIFARLTRASALEVISQDYVRTARAKGLPERAVRYRHILRNALIPVVTSLGFALAGLAFTSFVVERFFGIPGVGNLLIEAIFARDFPVVNGVVLVGTTLFINGESGGGPDLSGAGPADPAGGRLCGLIAPGRDGRPPRRKAAIM